MMKSFSVLALLSSLAAHHGTAFVVVGPSSATRSSNGAASCSTPPSVVAQQQRHQFFMSDTAVNGAAASTTTSSQSATDFVKDLLEGLDSAEGGKKLLESSTDSWRSAIYEAVGAPATADPAIVAKALQDAMSRPDNQFAILMGKAEKFDMVFPSDPVEYEDDGTSWVEVRLRTAGHRTPDDEDELLVTMGVSLQKSENSGNWLLSKLDWQDFRDEFYPGLSGREWLRAF